MKRERVRHSKKYILKRLSGYVFEYKFRMMLALVLMIASNALALAGPELAGRAIDCITAKGGVDFHGTYKNAVLMLGVYALSAAASYVLTFVISDISKKMSMKMRSDIFSHLSKLPTSFFDNTQTGDTVSRITYDVDTINASVTTDVLQIGASAVTVVGAFAMMCAINLKLLCVFLVTIPVTVWFTKHKTKKVEPLFKARSKSLGELNGYAEQMMSGLRSVKVYGAEDATLSRFDSYNKEAAWAYYNADYNACVVGPCVNFINNISLTIISVLGSLLYINGMISIGQISSFLLYSRKFSGPVNEAANLISELQSAFAAADRIFDILDRPAEKADDYDAYVLENTKGDVELKNIVFGYVTGKTVINDISFKADAGKIIAVVGPTGAGKSTMINLLMRFYDPDSGTITVDENDTIKITRESLRKNFTMVLQDTWLFSGTVAENIAYGREGADIEDVKRAATAAGINDFIESLENGYDTRLDDDGVSVSKGQKQLITIARAMLNDSNMLILDEATSNVDSQTEIRISEAMTSLMRGKTCFIIAHRLSTVKNADCILVIDGGKIVERGTHDELLAKNGFYSAIYNSQFE